MMDAPLENLKNQVEGRSDPPGENLSMSAFSKGVSIDTQGSMRISKGSILLWFVTQSSIYSDWI